MTDSEKVKLLIKVLVKPLAWYQENKEDEDYCYDQAYAQIQELDRADFLQILKILWD